MDRPGLGLFYPIFDGAPENANSGRSTGLCGVAVLDRRKFMELDSLAVRRDLTGDTLRSILCRTIRLNNVSVCLEAVGGKLLACDTRTAQRGDHRFQCAQRSALDGLCDSVLQNRAGSRWQLGQRDLSDGVARLVEVNVSLRKRWGDLEEPICLAMDWLRDQIGDRTLTLSIAA